LGLLPDRVKRITEADIVITDGWQQSLLFEQDRSFMSMPMSTLPGNKS
jgi:hypothetical protein